jgi:hypothetical protein
MNILTQRLPGLPVGLLRMMFGLLWLQAALQKAPWVINAQGQRFGWLSNWLWTETQHPTFGFYKAMLEHVVLPHFTFFGWLSFVVELALGVSLLLGLLTVLSGIGGALWQCNIAIGSLALQGPYRPDRYGAVATLFSLRDQQRPGLDPRRVDQAHGKDHGPGAW